MKPLTEEDLRLALKDSDVSTYNVPVGTIVTPAAEEYLKARRIELTYGRNQTPAEKSRRPAPKWDFTAPRSQQPDGEPTKLLFYGPDGGQLDHKPEAMTHLKGRQLVYKNHPVIIWRGKLDSFCSHIIAAQVLGHKEGNQSFVDDLQEVLDFSHRLLSCELRGKEVEEFYLLGLSVADLRERSHDPVKFYGHKHMLADYRMGPLCIALNELRSEVREVELAAADAFIDFGKAVVITRNDIITALNRLSSLFYIMMFKYLPEGFEPAHSGI